MIKNIGFVSTRFCGTDGVSLESSKWADVLERNGLRCFWFAGKLDRDLSSRFLVPEAFFQHERNAWINDRVAGRKKRDPSVTEAIHQLRSCLKSRLHKYINHFDIDLLIIENALSIPMHIPLGLAITETIAETQIPSIAHHHDFCWERTRYSVNAVNDYLCMAFPPNLPNIRHVVINSEAREQLALRTGISANIIPNVIDFDHPPAVNPGSQKAFRDHIGLKANHRIILQPTRVIQRKGIEFAIELIKQLGDPDNVLVVSHEAGDEGFEYADWLKHYARDNHVDLRMVGIEIGDPWSQYTGSTPAYSLQDIYSFADFITYPSLYEGFGNAFLEAIYYKKPILINRYATFVRDIEPLGFKLAVMDGYLSGSTVDQVRNLLNHPEKRERMIEHNYRVAARHYSYHVLCRQMNAVMADLLDGQAVMLCSKSPEHRYIQKKSQKPIPEMFPVFEKLSN